MEVKKREVKEARPGRWYGLIQLSHHKKPRALYGDSEQQVNQRLDLYIENEQKIQEENAKTRAQKRAERSLKNAEAATLVKPGSIFYTSWGYEQTNIDFYQVVAVHGKLAEIRPIAGKSIEENGHHQSGRTVADKDNFTGPSEKKLIQSDYKGRPSFRIASYASAYEWDGLPKSYSWGH